MDKFDRLYQLHNNLAGRKTPISVGELAERLECTEKSVRRYIEQLRDYYRAPIENIRGKGYRYSPDNHTFELPGLWFTEHDVQSLVLLLDILGRFGNGLLQPEFDTIRQRVDDLLLTRGIERSELEKRLKIIPLGHRIIASTYLQKIFEAVLTRKQMHLVYVDYQKNKTKRAISPQRLVYYRDNWYVDAWCHVREALRTFSLARIDHCEVLSTKAKAVSNEVLEQHVSTGYGMFSGQAKHKAVLRFDQHIAREIALQKWHPNQQARWHGGEYVLEIPYSHAAELEQDILRHMPHVYVEKPEQLRKSIQNKLQQGLERSLGQGHGFI